MADRVIAYIDGYNLYFGLRAAALQRYFWLNPSAMCRALLKPGQVLSYTKYFTARVSSPPDSVRRQTTFIEAIQTLPDLTVYEGKYDGEHFRCEGCGRAATWHNEKMTDVNIAVEIAKDAHAHRFDVALLVTGDGDQTPTVRMVRQVFPEKRIIAAFPPRRVSNWLRQEANGYVHINPNILSTSQLPGVVTKPDGYDLRCPREWT